MTKAKAIDFNELLLLLAAIAVSACMAAPCKAGTLRGEVLLDKDVMTVGDIFGDVGEASAKVVGPAPAPGQKVTYDVMALSALARNFNIAWQPGSNYERVTLTRASQTINNAMIREKVAAELAAHGVKKDLDILLDNSQLEVHRAPGIKLEWQVTDLVHDPLLHRFKGSLVVGSGLSAEIIAISGRAMPVVNVATLLHAIPAGAELDDRQIEWVRVPGDKAGADAVTDISQLQGMETRRKMDENATLRLRDLVKARQITKGSLVSMEIQMPTMQINAQGRALSNGVMGETVRIMNTQSNRTVDAVVIGKNKVSVMPVGPSHVASVNRKAEGAVQ
jgi:flagella basal body P-ring formation protein FlgA